MAVKFFDMPDIGTVRVSKRRGSRSVRLTIAPDGEIRVTIPSWTPFHSGVEFAESRADWILAHKPPVELPLLDGFRIGKAHRLTFLSAAIDAPTSRLIGTEVRITRPAGMALTHPAVQIVAHRAAIRALRSQAEALLPQRLKTLATQFSFNYHSVSVKSLKGRWGSCDNKQDIVLNLFLMQLPWPLIDYVLLHELTHTKFLNHGADFWQEFLKHEPTAKSQRKLIRLYKPVLAAKQPIGTRPSVT